MGSQNNIKWLKPDLKMAIDKIKAEPGDVLIVRPKDQFSVFSADYVQWLQQNLYEVMPPGVRGLILTGDHTDFVRLSPDQFASPDTTTQMAYEDGWRAAFNALEQYYTKNQPPTQLEIVQ